MWAKTKYDLSFEHKPAVETEELNKFFCVFWNSCFKGGHPKEWKRTIHEKRAGELLNSSDTYDGLVYGLVRRLKFSKTYISESASGSFLKLNWGALEHMELDQWCSDREKPFL
jgi:hypothetical protein